MIPLSLQIVHLGVKFYIESFNVSRQCLRQIYHLFARPTASNNKNTLCIWQILLDKLLKVPTALVYHFASYAFRYNTIFASKASRGIASQQLRKSERQ
jgi:hypothetical protein